MKEFLQSVQENAAFLLTCLGIFAALVLVAWVFQRLLVKNRRAVSPARRVSYVAMFSAVAALLMLIEIPLFFAPAFYKIDLSEIPVLICAFYLGPVAGVVTELVKVLLKLLLKGTTTAFVGDFANFVVGCSLVLPATIIYHTHKSRHSALIGLAVGCICMTVFGSAFNAVYLLPKFAQLYGLPLDTIIAMGTKINGNIHNVSTFVLICVAPLNLIKSAAVSVLTLLLYKRVARPLFGLRQ